MEWSFLSNFGITLFALLNPLGMLPIFISYTSRERIKVQRMVALFVSFTVLGLLLIFMLIGSPMLQFFGVTINSFRLAGGILLLIIGISIVNGNDSSANSSLLAPENENDLTQ
jgi:small neutral amino acid transporter SnatA (MarC family)